MKAFPPRDSKFLIGIGAAFFSVFILGIAAVVGINTMTERMMVSNHPATTKLSLPTGPSQAADAQSQAQPISAGSPVAKTAVSPQIASQAAPVPVLDSDLAKLAFAVKLGRTNAGDAGKEVWARETPIAEKLLQEGLCDCDQRNWLKHFVETGHEALLGSEAYFQSIQVLAKLRRSNQDLTTNQASH